MPLATLPSAMNSGISSTFCLVTPSSSPSIMAFCTHLTSRDQAWSPRISAAVSRLHLRFNSPWVATTLLGATGLIWCLVPLDLLLILIGEGTAERVKFDIGMARAFTDEVRTLRHRSHPD